MRPGRTTATHPSGEPLPDPIRVSAGFLVYGLSGKMRIHTLPSLLRYLLIAIRADSICLLVIQCGSIAFSPYEPNVTCEPLSEVPVILPRIVFLLLTLLGDNILFL